MVATPTKAAPARELHNPTGLNITDATARITEAKQQEAKEQAEKSQREEQERASEVARVKAEKSAKQKAARTAKEQVEAKERAEKDAREEVERRAKEMAERLEREEEDHSGLPPIATSSAPGRFDGVGNFDLPGKKYSPDGAEDLNTSHVSARISVSSRSENERWMNGEQGPSTTGPTPPTLSPELGPETLLKPAPSLTPAHRPQVPAPAPAPVKIEPEKPLSLWERKKLKVASPPAPASSLFGRGDGMNPSGIWGDVSDEGRNTESIVMPNIAGDRQSIFTDTARDQKRENQRENVIEGLLGSNPARRRNDSAQSQTTTKPAPKHPAPAPPPQKASGWGSWGSSLTNIANAVTIPDRTPSPELPPVKPKIEDPPRGFTPNQPPKSQPVGFGSLNKPAWGTGGGSGDNNAWGAAKPGPTPIAQKPSTGPAWGAKPVPSTFGSGGTGWRNGTSSTFGSGVGKNLTVDTATKPLEGRPNTAGPENIPEWAVEIKDLPAPGGSGSAITKKTSRDPSPVRENAPQTEVTEEPARTEKTATPAEDEEFDWASMPKKKKKNKRG